MRHKIRIAIIGLVLLAAARTPVVALELSHFSSLPGMMFMDDFFLPPTEQGTLFYAQYNAYYGTDTFRNADGRSVDQITLQGPAGNPRTIDVDIDIDNFVIAPVLLFSPGWKLLGARYGALAVLPTSNLSVAAGLQTEIGLGISAEDSSWGLGDLFVQPLFLEWNLDRVDVTATYGFYAPTGRYERGAPDNTGLGFWGHQLQSALRYRLNDNVAASVALTGEINHNKEGADIVPGSHLTMNWGVRRHFLDDWFQFGVVGYDTWQVSDDSGSDVTRKDDDEVHAVGLQVGVPRLGLALKYMREFNAKDRFEGDTASIFFALPLDFLLAWAGTN